MGRDIFHYIRLLKDQTNMTLIISKNVAFPDSLGNQISIFILSPFKVLEGCSKVSPKPFLQAKQPQHP